MLRWARRVGDLGAVETQLCAGRETHIGAGRVGGTRGDPRDARNTITQADPTRTRDGAGRSVTRTWKQRARWGQVGQVGGRVGGSSGRLEWAAGMSG